MDTVKKQGCRRKPTIRWLALLLGLASKRQNLTVMYPQQLVR